MTGLAYFIYALKWGFTTYNGLGLFALSLLSRSDASAPASHARAVLLCTTLGVASSFTTAWIMDRTAFPRIAKRLDLTLAQFHVANLVVHLLPCALVTRWEHAPLAAWHGAAAALMHCLWGSIVSRGIMCLDDIYVPLPRASWRLLWAVALLTELSVPALAPRV